MIAFLLGEALNPLVGAAMSTAGRSQAKLQLAGDALPMHAFFLAVSLVLEGFCCHGVGMV